MVCTGTPRNTVSVKALGDRDDAHGVKDLHVTFYPGGRHGMLNEIDRDVVTADAFAWLNEHLGTSERPPVAPVSLFRP